MTMQNYSCYCTEEQTKRAYKLGAPLSIAPNDFFTSKNSVQIDSELYRIPTTQQMIALFREKRLMFLPLYNDNSRYAIRIFVEHTCIYTTNISTYEQAELAAIDVALDYLEKGGTK